MKRGKKGQIYIIAAVIIVFVIIGSAAVSNYTYTRDKPAKFYDIGGVLKLEGIKTIEYSEYNEQDVSSNIDLYLNLFKDYLEANTAEDFNLVIIYGDINSEQVSGRIFTRASLGDISISLGGGEPFITGGTAVEMKDTTVTLNPAEEGEPQTVTVTIISDAEKGISLTQVLPVLDDNNFVFVMTTSSGFNQYVQTSQNPENP